MKPRNLLLIAILCSVSLLMGSRSAVPQSPSATGGSKASEALRGPLQEKLDQLHAQGKFPGATAGFAFSDGSTLGLATGISDRETGAAMSPQNLLFQGSCGKTYVSAVALQLVHERKFSLDDPVSRYLGKEPWYARLPNAQTITIRHLMNHTSGLTRYEFREQFTTDLTKNPYKVWKPEELVAYILDTKPPFLPGQGWTYADTNYIVLGMIIERVTKSAYYDQLRKRILKPLKLQHTVPSTGPVIPGLSQGYAGPNNVFGGSDAMIAHGKFTFNPQFEWTGGGIASTSEDLARWSKLLYEGKAFDPSLMPELLKGVPAQLGPESKYGLGVIIRPTAYGTSYGHSGFFPGYVTEMMYFPQYKTAVAVQVNSSVARATGKSPVAFITDFMELIRKAQMR
jgi:D-alanyl-D-alanine carboxypeptidase